MSLSAVFAGLSLQTFVQPIANQQSPSQVSGRQPSGGAVVPPVRVNISRGTTNTGNSGILSGMVHQFRLKVFIFRFPTFG